MEEALFRNLINLVKDGIEIFGNTRDIDVFLQCKESLIIGYNAVCEMSDCELKDSLLKEIDDLAFEINGIEESINKFPRPATILLSKYYDYCFLKYMHERLGQHQVETIVVGSSHALNGISEKVFKTGCINLSMHSQDLFYDYANLRKALDETIAPIKNCIIIMGYYIIAQDVSLESRYGHEMIKRVYAPVLNETHNWSQPESLDVWNDKDLLFSMRAKGVSVEEAWLEVCQWFDDNPTYYNSFRGRGNGIFDFEGKKWFELSPEERDAFGKRRTDDHNKILKYETTIEENYKIFDQLIELLIAKGIKPYVVITPFTSEYNKYISPKYKELIKKALEGKIVEFIDMNELNICSEIDFVDTDHLNEKGAEKVSRFLFSHILDGVDIS